MENLVRSDVDEETKTDLSYDESVITLVPTGESESDVTHVLDPRKYTMSPVLTEVGKKRAKDVGELLSTMVNSEEEYMSGTCLSSCIAPEDGDPMQHLFCSPLPRSVQTAIEIGKVLHDKNGITVKIVVIPCVQEDANWLEWAYSFFGAPHMENTTRTEYIDNITRRIRERLKYSFDSKKIQIDAKYATYACCREDYCMNDRETLGWFMPNTTGPTSVMNLIRKEYRGLTRYIIVSHMAYIRRVVSEWYTHLGISESPPVKDTFKMVTLTNNKEDPVYYGSSIPSHGEGNADRAEFGAIADAESVATVPAQDAAEEKEDGIVLSDGEDSNIVDQPLNYREMNTRIAWVRNIRDVQEEPHQSVTAPPAAPLDPVPTAAAAAPRYLTAPPAATTGPAPASNLTAAVDPAATATETAPPASNSTAASPPDATAAATETAATGASPASNSTAVPAAVQVDSDLSPIEILKLAIDIEWLKNEDLIKRLRLLKKDTERDRASIPRPGTITKFLSGLAHITGYRRKVPSQDDREFEEKTKKINALKTYIKDARQSEIDLNGIQDTYKKVYTALSKLRGGDERRPPLIDTIASLIKKYRENSRTLNLKKLYKRLIETQQT